MTELEICGWVGLGWGGRGGEGGEEEEGEFVVCVCMYVFRWRELQEESMGAGEHTSERRLATDCPVLMSGKRRCRERWRMIARWYWEVRGREVSTSWKWLLSRIRSYKMGRPLAFQLSSVDAFAMVWLCLSSVCRI